MKPSHKVFWGIYVCFALSFWLSRDLSAVLCARGFSIFSYFDVIFFVNDCVRLRFVLCLLWLHVNNLALLCFSVKAWLSVILSDP